MILPEWARKPEVKPVLEGLFSDEKITELNLNGYNVYYLPNGPKQYPLVSGKIVDGTDIDNWQYVFVDCDIKDGVYKSKEEFIAEIKKINIIPTAIVDSGNGIHVYWKIQNLDVNSYLRFQRRLLRLYKTDEAVSKIFQLMRLPGTQNTKNQNHLVECITIELNDNIYYTAEEFDKLLPPITPKDEEYCIQHYNSTYSLETDIVIDEKLPAKFGKFLSQNHEAKELFSEQSDDRSKADYRLGHLMFANGFTREEALSVLINSSKALSRAPIHRKNYAKNIVDKIWTFENSDGKNQLSLSMSVKELLMKSGDTLKGTSFRCHKRIDNTERGFRLGDVIGLVAGSGVGKTALALNMFRWFAQENPDYHHFFIPLEQPANEIAERWEKMCGEDKSLHDKVHVISNYDEDGNFRHLSFDEIKEYIQKFQKVTGNKIGCVVIDHIGALKKQGKNGEKEDLMAICHAMKAFAVQTNTLLVMQSQTNREKAGIGDLELNKDAAYGTGVFEWYCDYLITMWQPLKRVHDEKACPTVTAFKYCKIRHKKPRNDIIHEDVIYFMYFDTDTEQMRDMTQDEKTSFNYFLPKATNKRKADRKTEILKYQSVPYKSEDSSGTTTNHN